MAFGVYFKSIIPGVNPLLPGLAVVWIISLVHLRGMQYGSAFHNLWTALKLLLIVGFLAAGLLLGTRQPISFTPSASDLNFVTSVPFAISLVFVMYSYSGWNAATYIIGEIEEPNRSLPRALFLGTLIVIGLYVGLNAVFLAVTPIQDLAGQVNVAMIAGTHLFGEVGGRIVGMLICLGLVSSISAMMWIGPRVTMTMGEDMPLLRAFSRRSDKGVPANAIIFQLVISTLLLASQSFDAVLEFVQFSLTFCSFFTVLGVIKMRITHPNMPRPYRAWGYPVTPVVFLTVMLWMMYYLVVNRPVESLAGFAIMLSGVAIYALSLFLSKSMSADTPNATV